MSDEKAVLFEEIVARRDGKSHLELALGTRCQKKLLP